MTKRLLPVCCALILAGCSSKKITISNSADVGTSPADMSGYSYLTEGSSSFVQMSLSDSARFFSDGGSGIIYYGKTDCVWCQLAVPELGAAAQELGVTVYYVDVTNATSDESYQTVYNDLKDTFVSNTSADKAFMIPEVIAVKNGKIVSSHLSIVDGFEMVNEGQRLSSLQEEQLRSIYRKLMRAAAD